MPKEFGRNRRVAQFIKEELSVFIQREFPLQHYGIITLTNVDVGRDLGKATIFVTTLNNQMSSDSVPDKSPSPASMQANEKLVAELNEQAGHFRHEISRIMTSRSVPSLCFKYDVSIERAQRLTDIIDAVSKSDNKMSDE